MKLSISLVAALLLIAPTVRAAEPVKAARSYDPQILPQGHEYFNLRDGLHNSQARFVHDKVGRVVFLGGSITASSGWRDGVMRWLQQRFPQTKFEFVAAGVPSLGSVPHAFRLDRDVLSRGPVDLLIVEAAVNDTANGATSAQMLRGMEGVVRHARQANPLTDIVHLHFVMPSHMDDYNHGRTPTAVEQHEKVAAHYGNPSLNLSREVTDRINARQFTWAADFRDLHPSPFGHQLYTNSITRMLAAAYPKSAAKVQQHTIPEPLDAQSYFRGRFGPLDGAKLIRGFQLVKDWTPSIPRETRGGYVHVPALAATEPGAEFEFTFDGTAAGLMIGAGPNTGILEVSIDGGPTRKIDTFTQWSRALYLPWALMLAEDLPSGSHTARVRLAKEHNPHSAGTALYVFQLLEN